MTRISTSSVVKTMLLAAVGAISLAGAVPAFAASVTTDAFVANVQPNVEYLDQSSRLAIANATGVKLRAFARDEATEQTRAGNELVAWTQTRAFPTPDVASNGTASNGTDGVDGMLTGRSVATDAPANTANQPRTAAPGTLLPSGETDMKRLAELRGRRFDALYATTQKYALRHLVTLYTYYLRDGDDEALRGMAERQLPIAKHRLAQLAGM